MRSISPSECSEEKACGSTSIHRVAFLGYSSTASCTEVRTNALPCSLGCFMQTMVDATIVTSCTVRYIRLFTFFPTPKGDIRGGKMYVAEGRACASRVFFLISGAAVCCRRSTGTFKYGQQVILGACKKNHLSVNLQLILPPLLVGGCYRSGVALARPSRDELVTPNLVNRCKCGRRGRCSVQ